MFLMCKRGRRGRHAAVCGVEARKTMGEGEREKVERKREEKWSSRYGKMKLKKYVWK
jgi:hypothetical protein